MNDLVNTEDGNPVAIGWRNVFKVHPACAILRAMPPDQLRALGEDIKANGLQETIKYVRYNRRTEQYDDASRRPSDDDDVDLILIDGRNRLDAMEMVGERVPTTLDEFDEFSESENLWFRNDEKIVRHIISANIHRRHLTPEDKKRFAAQLLKLAPERSNLSISKDVGLSHPTVAMVRTDLEESGDVEKLSTRTDAMGRQQPARRKTTTPKKLRGAAVEVPPEKVQDGEPTLFDDLSPSLAPEASPAEKRDAAPPKPAEAPQPLDPAREHLTYILGGTGAFRHVPLDADFNRMATIIDPGERERCKDDMKMVGKIARHLLIALERSDLERSDPPMLPPAA
jgi:hypothetical protein